MSSVAIHPPKTPVTEGSMTVAKATLPNVCKMPGPPAPFVPAPLPNIAKSGNSPSGYSTSVKIEGHAVAIRGATFESIGDVASKGTGGGLISANTQGPAKFITPGSMTVKIEGKAVHLLGEPMLNNCGPSGTPPNTGATMSGASHDDNKMPKCPPHKLEWDPLTPKAEAERQAEQEKNKQGHKQKMNKFLYKAQQSLASGDVAGSNAHFATAAEAEGQMKDIEYEQKVAKETNAKWTGVKYKCTNGCNVKGEIDVITPNGTIKECKRAGTIPANQVAKYEIMGPAMLGAGFSGVHMAHPPQLTRNARSSINDQGLQGRCGRQPH